MRLGLKMSFCRVVASVLSMFVTTGAALSMAPAVPNGPVQQLSERFWTWRATEQPFTEDDIPRIERPAAFVSRWTKSDAAAYREKIGQFEQEWRALAVSDAPVATQVDWRLLGSAIARVRWELDVLPDWKRNPRFYVDQGLGGVYAAVLVHPFSDAQKREMSVRLESVPRLLEEGRANLTDMRRPYANVTMEYLNGIEKRMQAFRDAVHAEAGLKPQELAAFDKAENAAASALVAFREWLRTQIAAMPQQTAVGRESYLWFLRNVALLPYTPEQMLAIGAQEFQRAVAFEALQAAADTGLPPVPVYASSAIQAAEEVKQEKLLRAYMVSHGMLSEPAGVRHYYYLPIPAYVKALGLGVTDDLTGPTRLDRDSSSYKETPSADSGFFSAITARDTRPLLIHEGVPGHYYQMAWSWHHPDPVRRHYYDSQSNEGIGFYAEEMMLVGGLFEDQPKTKEAIYRMMRLRALRVVVDVKLAIGAFTLEQAAQYLETTVPMDRGTARSEAAMFASTPGQAITYQIGKTDILRLMTDARLQQKSDFNLQRFQDAVWLNGNVPFSLQRWEMLGDNSDVPVLPASFDGPGQHH